MIIVLKIILWGEGESIFDKKNRRKPENTLNSLIILLFLSLLNTKDHKNFLKPKYGENANPVRIDHLSIIPAQQIMDQRLGI